MFLKIGHRGARAYETENTLQSFRKAIELGANALELDVRKTGDGRLVVSHDEDLKRVYGKDIPVGRSALKELKSATGDKLLSLEEALNFMRGKVERALVELKETGYEREVIETIKKEKMIDRVIISSFHEGALEITRRLDEMIETGLIYSKFKNPVAAALKLKADYLVPLYRFIHTRNVEDAHKNSLKVIVWTINTREEAEAYRNKGVDGIASDRPDILNWIKG